MNVDVRLKRLEKAAGPRENLLHLLRRAQYERRDPI